MSYQSKFILAVLMAVSAGVSVAQQRTDGRDLYQLRSQPMMKIQVLGQVRTPGIYSLPVMERASAALAAAGGTNEQGSPRSIQLVRQGLVIDTLDMYHYLYQNQQSQNPVLEDGDIIFIPVNNNNIKVVGQVFRPGIYEVKPGGPEAKGFYFREESDKGLPGFVNPIGIEFLGLNTSLLTVKYVLSKILS